MANDKPSPVITFSWDYATSNSNRQYTEECNVFEVESVKNYGSDKVIITYKDGRERTLGTWNNPFSAYLVQRRIDQRKATIERFKYVKQLRVLENVQPLSG